MSMCSNNSCFWQDTWAIIQRVCTRNGFAKLQTVNMFNGRERDTVPFFHYSDVVLANNSHTFLILCLQTSNYCNFLEFSKTICVAAWKGHNASRRANSKTPLCKIKNSFSNTLHSLHPPSFRCNFALNLRLYKHKATTTYIAGSVWTFSTVLFMEMLNILHFSCTSRAVIGILISDKLRMYEYT